MKQALRSLLVAGVALSGCAEPAATLSVALWQPERFADGEVHDYKTEAENIAVTLVIDGAVAVDRLIEPPLDVAVPSVELDAEQSVLEVIFTFVHPEALDASAYTGPVEVRRGESARATAVLAPPLAAHVLDEVLPPALDGAALCAGPDDTIRIVGGAAPAPSPQSFLLDPARTDFVTGPVLPAGRAGGACVVVDDTVWAVFGCADDASPPALFRSTAGGAFASVSPAPDGAGCGADVAVAGGGLWLALGDRVERRSLDGAVDVDVDLPAPRYGARLVPFADGVWLVGGRDAPEGGALVLGALRISSQGTVTSTGDDTFTAVSSEGLAWADGLVRFDDDGPSEVATAGALGLPVDFEVAGLSTFGADGYALLSLDGLKLHVVNGDVARTLELPEARPGAALFSDRAGAVKVAGGAAAGTLVVVPSPPTVTE